MKFILLFSILLLIQNSLHSQTILNDELYTIKDFNFIRDTVYTLKPYFIEINLNTQKAYLHSKKDSIIEFGVSTGTKWVKDGVNTKEGLYVIQSMMPKWHSRQFDSTLMLNWMGFNYGIGFHALLGKSYYKYLGVKRSSHGCVRISREVALDIYSKIELGTPVLVHSENNAVWISFIDSSSNSVFYTSDKLNDRLKERYNSIYAGNYFLEEKEPVIIDSRNVSHPGLPIGERKRISKRQLLKPFYKYISAVTPKVKELMKIDIIWNSKFDIMLLPSG